MYLYLCSICGNDYSRAGCEGMCYRCHAVVTGCATMAERRAAADRLRAEGERLRERRAS